MTRRARRWVAWLLFRAAWTLHALGWRTGAVRLVGAGIRVGGYA